MPLLIKIKISYLTPNTNHMLSLLTNKHRRNQPQASKLSTLKLEINTCQIE